MKIQPYLFFDGRCEEALQFYHARLGAEIIALMRFRDSPEPHPPGMLPPGAEDKVMHAALAIGDTIVMASDGHCGGKPDFQGFSLSLTVAGPDQAMQVFSSLAADGKVTMPLAPTFFSPSFGMLTDRFGVPWMIYAEQAH